MSPFPRPLQAARKPVVAERVERQTQDEKPRKGARIAASGLTIDRVPLRDLLHLLSPLVTSCRGFHEAWDSSPAPASGDPLSGRWEGDWVSEANGFRGPLRAVMTRVDDDRWRAAFHATFGKVLKACYSTELVIDRGTDLVRDRGPERSAALECTFKGSSDLGVFGGGVYEYAAEVAGDVFTSTFRSRTDHGTFRMRRV